MTESEDLLKKIRNFLDDDIANLECNGSVYTLPDDEWGHLMFLWDEIDLYFKKLERQGDEWKAQAEKK